MAKIIKVYVRIGIAEQNLFAQLVPFAHLIIRHGHRHFSHL
jgi:hypothetical protein